ncbi:MAG: hypothetical protein N2255_08995 [Kiritimatiellae bacterium]|nr:hypothetical protein [Kiritimatiellia bacterium]
MHLTVFSTVVGLSLGLVVQGAEYVHTAILSGLCRHTSYCSYNYLYQWEFGQSPQTSRYLGKVNLGVGGLFGADLGFNDVAMLSDRRVVVTHQDIAGTNYQVSVLSMRYDSAGLLTGAAIDITFNDLHLFVSGQRTRVAPLPNGGFVTVRGGGTGGTAVIWEKTGANTWAGSIVTGMVPEVWDVAGLFKPGATHFVTGQYVTPPGGSGARSAHKYGKTGLLARYYNGSRADRRAWGYGPPGEGLRTPLLNNGWVTVGYQAESYGTYIYDGTQTGGNVWYDGFAGEITTNGAAIYQLNVGALNDGRVVLWRRGGWLQTVVGYLVFTLIPNPGGRTGTVGADMPDFYVEFPGNFPNYDRDGRIAGDYMWQKPPPRETLILIK